jgi:hypothetical protein
MIVLDEQLADPRIIRGIERWYKGKVIRIIDVRPRTTVPDEAIPVLLRQLSAPTFVTINHRHFWRKIPASPDYCVICLKLPAEHALEIPEALRAVLSRPEWRAKRGRLGNVILVSDRPVAYYSSKQGPIELVPR